MNKKWASFLPVIWLSLTSCATTGVYEESYQGDDSASLEIYDRSLYELVRKIPSSSSEIYIGVGDNDGCSSTRRVEFERLYKVQVPPNKTILVEWRDESSHMEIHKKCRVESAFHSKSNYKYSVLFGATDRMCFLLINEESPSGVKQIAEPIQVDRGLLSNKLCAK